MTGSQVLTLSTSSYNSNYSKPRYVPDKFPVYQLDFSKESKGKQFSKTKRRIRWRFGFSNADAISSGLIGAGCRGEEHEVVLIWSITSGKRFIMVDGEEMHYSCRKREGKFEFSWTMPGHHIAKIVAHATPALNPPPGWHQFNMFLDGRSFFDFPKIYELGQTKKGGKIESPLKIVGVSSRATSDTRSNSTNSVDENPPNAQKQEQQDFLLDFTNNPGLSSSVHDTVTTNNSSLTSFVQDSISTKNYSLTSFAQDSITTNNSSLTSFMQDSVASNFSFYATENVCSKPSVAEKLIAKEELTNKIEFEQPNFCNTLNEGAMSYSYVRDADVRVQPIQQENSHGMIIESYSATHEMKSTENDIPVTYDAPQHHVGQFCQTNQISNVTSAPVSHSSEEQVTELALLSTESLEGHEHDSLDSFPKKDGTETPFGDVDQALKKLVNFDDIFSAPDSEDAAPKLTMKSNVEDRKQTNYSSRGLPPVADAWCGPQPSLSEMKAVKVSSTIKSEMVMKTSMPTQNNSGALVVSQAPQLSYGERMLPSTMGFGAGMYTGGW